MDPGVYIFMKEDKPDRMLQILFCFLSDAGLAHQRKEGLHPFCRKWAGTSFFVYWGLITTPFIIFSHQDLR